MKRTMAGKTVLITGAARGIGFCAAHEFAQAECDLVLVDRDPEGLAQAEEQLRAPGRRLLTFALDVGDQRAVEAMAKEVLAQLGRLDVLVNNAGIGYTADLANTALSTWRTLFDVNFWGPLHLIDAFLPSMRARRSGRIVNVSSGQAFLRLPGWGAYATTKVALAGFSEILHYELRSLGIHVATVYPFLVKTRFYEQAQPRTAAGRLALHLSLRLADTPEKVGRRVFEAAALGRARDRVSWLNEIGYYAQMVPPLATAVERSVAWVFGEKAAVPGPAPAPGLGFRIDEEMAGEHELEPGYGPAGRRPMSFRITWGPDNVRAWLTPGPAFMTQPLEGRVSIDGLAKDAPCRGTLELRYREGRIRYEFGFEAGGRRYRYAGEKVNIKPWNLPVSHTTLFGRITEADSGRLVSTSVLHFAVRGLPRFLRTFRLTRPARAAEPDKPADAAAAA